MRHRSKFAAERRGRELASSPFFTPARRIEGQGEIPMVTYHPVCANCRQPYFCDTANCRVMQGYCPACRPDEPHSKVFSADDLDYFPDVDRHHGLYVVSWEIPGGTLALALTAEGELRAQNRKVENALLLQAFEKARAAVREEIEQNEWTKDNERAMHAQRSLFR